MKFVSSALSLVLIFHRTRRRLRFYCGGGLDQRTMNAALVSDECDCDEGQHYDENNALFVFRKFKNPEKAFHPTAA
jgi:hypothetical protein